MYGLVNEKSIEICYVINRVTVSVPIGHFLDVPALSRIKEVKMYFRFYTVLSRFTRSSQKSGEITILINITF